MDREDGSTTNSELAAFTAVVTALKPLDAQSRIRVVQSALVLLGGTISNIELAKGVGPPITHDRDLTVPVRLVDQPTDIRQLKQQKAPQSANEMAALVAYYLAEAAPASERKATVDIDDVQRYFKQAQFRLPNKPNMTLVNAKNAGYFDAAGGGQYRLNPVGYNLVVHSLPRPESEQRPVRKSPSKPRQDKGSRRKGRSTAR